MASSLSSFSSGSSLSQRRRRTIRLRNVESLFGQEVDTPVTKTPVENSPSSDIHGDIYKFVPSNLLWDWFVFINKIHIYFPMFEKDRRETQGKGEENRKTWEKKKNEEMGLDQPPESKGRDECDRIGSCQWWSEPLHTKRTKKEGLKKPETASLFLLCFFSSTFLYHYFFFNFLQSKFYSLFKILKLIAYISNNTSPVPRDSLNFSDRFNKGITLQFFESYEIVTCLVKFTFSFGRSWEESAAHVTSCLESIDMRCQETEKQKKGSEAGTNPYTNRIHNERMSLLVQCQKRKKKR